MAKMISKIEDTVGYLNFYSTHNSRFCYFVLKNGQNTEEVEKVIGCNESIYCLAKDSSKDIAIYGIKKDSLKIFIDSLGNDFLERCQCISALEATIKGIFDPQPINLSEISNPKEVELDFTVLGKELNCEEKRNIKKVLVAYQE